MKAENFDYSALPQDAFELTHNDIHKHVDRNFASQNYWKDALVRFLRNKGAIFGLIMIAIIIFFAAFGPSMTPYTYESQVISQQNLAPRIPGLENMGIFDGTEKMILGEIELEVNGYDKWEKESLKGPENPLVPYNVTEPRVLKCYVGEEEINGNGSLDKGEKATEIQFSGRLLGGCMDCLVNLLGTRFDKTREFVEKYKEDGIIWFLEACELNVFSIRRAMWQMEEAGWFEHTKGFLIGRPMNFGQEMMGLDAYKAILEVAGKKGVPVIMDMDLGHLAPMMPVIVGSQATVNVEGNDIALKMECK